MRACACACACVCACVECSRGEEGNSNQEGEPKETTATLLVTALVKVILSVDVVAYKMAMRSEAAQQAADLIAPGRSLVW